MHYKERHAVQREGHNREPRPRVEVHSAPHTAHRKGCNVEERCKKWKRCKKRRNNVKLRADEGAASATQRGATRTGMGTVQESVRTAEGTAMSSTF